MLIDRLGQYYTPDVKVYDTVKIENLKYISTILKLKENYIGDDTSYSQLNEATTNLIYSKFSKETFTGHVKYIYQASGQFQGRTIPIGTYLNHKDEK